MGINRFFSEMLIAPLSNPRWSWGAVDTLNSRVFLRVWSDHIADDKVRVGYESFVDQRLGFTERQLHLDLIRHGTEAYGVICHAADPTTLGAREIQSFDSLVLLKIGAIQTIDDESFGTIVAEIPVESLLSAQSSASRLAEDLELIEKLPQNSQKEQLVLARLGQGKYRDDLLKKWDYKCAITGSNTLCAIRASHIRPWKVCSDEQRLDPENGIPLIASLDALFDRGLISFEDSGETIISSELHSTEYQYFHIQGARLCQLPTKRMKEYLAFHRRERFAK